ncbi:hypothetical protein CGLO_03593 [Colletotrichum gloeosporioides Cg-14]|uniref:Uncharacterized protein n=1 Tax=Colletotrichum gloeosporioides (strain Cg-14) TaxID=1237896 RepID=T0KW90_COLGC|nr:hypothetical protein CGLO_03593 [Colletotrichum gloeosporioides Cg-14]
MGVESPMLPYATAQAGKLSQRTASVGEGSGQGDPLVYRSDGTLERT